MARVEDFSGEDMARVMFDMPAPALEIVTPMMRAVPGVENFRLQHITAEERGGDGFPRLFTMIDYPDRQPIPAVQGSHIRAFSRHFGINPQKTQLFINGVWNKLPPASSSSQKEIDEWELFRQTIIPGEMGTALAIKAWEMPTLYQHLIKGTIHLESVGIKTIKYAGSLSLAVQRSMQLYIT